MRIFKIYTLFTYVYIYLQSVDVYIYRIYTTSRSSLVVSKHGLYAGGPGSIPTALTTRTAAGGDAEHVSLKSLTCSTIPRCKIGTSQMLGGQL